MKEYNFFTYIEKSYCEPAHSNSLADHVISEDIRLLYIENIELFIKEY